MKRYCNTLTLVALTILSFTTANRSAAQEEDLSVAWIQRVPSQNFIQGSANPTRDGWPAAESTVTWRAIVKNWSNTDQLITYRWSVDGISVATGTVNLRAQSWTPVDYNRTWSFKRESLRFDIDIDNIIRETSEANNSLDVFTDAISLGLWVEQSLYDYFHLHQSKLGDGANGWEDWAQRQVRIINDIYAKSVYPIDAPEGVKDRIRIDKITLVADGALPLAGGIASNTPDNNDKTVDLVWGFSSQLTYTDTTNASLSNPFFYEGSLFHELGHARYLIDTYGFNFQDSASESGSNRILVRHNGQLIAGTPYLPMSVDRWDHFWISRDMTDDPFYGLMGGDYTIVDRYSTVALNLIAGQRALYNNVNAPDNIGSFKNDLPASNRVKLIDGFGQSLPNATVKIYQSVRGTADWYGKMFNDVVALTFSSDSSGFVDLGRNPFSSSSLEHTYGLSNMILLVKVEQAGKAGFAFIHAGIFNLAYWRGQTQVAEYTLKLPMLGPERNIAFVTSWPNDNRSTVQVIVSGDQQPSSVTIAGLSASYRDGSWSANTAFLNGSCLIVATWADGQTKERLVSLPVGSGEHKLLLGIAPEIPAAPSNLTATAVSSSQIDLSWPDVSGETQYLLERKVGLGAYATLMTKGANSVTHSDLTVNASTNYTYRIRSENSTAYSDFTESNAVATPAAPTQPTPATSSSSSVGGGGGGGGGASLWFVTALCLVTFIRLLRRSKA